MAELKRTQLGKAGSLGEDAAAEYLTRAGAEILDRNIRFGKLELDIVYKEDRYVVFAEVKSRTVSGFRNSRYGSPASAVTYAKQKKLISAARTYLQEKHPGGYPRFDVLEVYLTKDAQTGNVQLLRINHIRNAFGAT